MPRNIIFCKDCKSEKKDIERNGRLKVVSCKPLPNQEHLPEDQKECKIVWEINI